MLLEILENCCHFLFFYFIAFAHTWMLLGVGRRLLQIFLVFFEY